MRARHARFSTIMARVLMRNQNTRKLPFLLPKIFKFFEFMKFVCLIFLIALCVIVKGAPSSSLVDAMKEEMKELAMTAPAQAFITNLQSTGTYNSKVIAPADLLNTLTLWKLTGDAITKFQAAVFASKMTFETFHFVVGPTSAQLNEFVGCAKYFIDLLVFLLCRNNGATIEIAYMSVSATGTLQTQYNTVTTRHCKRCHLVKKCCHDDHTQVARGFSTAELANIEQALRASAYAKLVQELANPPTVFSVVETKLSRFIGSKASTSPADELLEKAIEALMKKFPELKKYLATNTTSTLMKVYLLFFVGIHLFRKSLVAATPLLKNPPHCSALMALKNQICLHF